MEVDCSEASLSFVVSAEEEGEGVKATSPVLGLLSNVLPAEWKINGRR
jgi:hypothetical protein